MTTYSVGSIWKDEALFVTNDVLEAYYWAVNYNETHSPEVSVYEAV